MLHVLFLQAIMAVKTFDLRVLNKRGEALKEAAIADLTKQDPKLGSTIASILNRTNINVESFPRDLISSLPLILHILLSSL